MAQAKNKKKPAAKVKSKAKPAAKKVVKPAKKSAKPAPKKKVVVKKKPTPVKAKKTVVKKAKSTKSVAKKKVAVKPVKKVLKKVSPKSKPIAKVSVKPSKPVVKASAKPAQPKPVAKQVQSSPKAAAKTPTKSANKMNENLHRYSDEELKEFKTLIDKKLVTAREELAYLKESLDNHTDSQAGNKAWNMEEGSDTSEMETMMNQISRQHGYIRNLELALARIENKTYGICRSTGQLIPKERLRVVPHATLCLEAKMSRKVDDAHSEQTAQAAPPTDFAENFED